MNVTCSQYSYYYQESMKLSLLICILICCVLILPTLLLNGTILLLSSKDRGELTISKILLINLVVTDLLIGCFTLPSTAIKFSLLELGNPSCTLFLISNPISFYLAIVSFTTLTQLTIDRYIKFLHPYKHVELSCKSFKVSSVLFSWTMPLIPILTNTILEDARPIDYFVVYVGAVYVTIQLFGNFRVFFLIRKQRKEIKATEQRFSSPQSVKKETNLAILGLLLFTSTVLCHLPVICLAGLGTTSNRDDRRLRGSLAYWGWTIACCSPVMNPLVKFYRLSNLRAALVGYYRKFFHSGNHVEVMPSCTVN